MRSLFSKKRKICLVLALLWMGIIFLFSAQKSDESTQISNGAGRCVVKAVNEIMDKGWSEEKVEEYALVIDHPIRKLAHAAEYGILALLWYGVMSSHWKAIAIAFLYACTDEFHQLFVPGRAGMFKDVLIDTSGAIVFMLVVWVVGFVVSSWRAKRDTL